MIEKRAFGIGHRLSGEEEGRPEGRDREHWERAAAEVNAEERAGEQEADTASPYILKPTTAVR